VDAVRQAILNDRFCMETVGIELLEIGPGQARARLAIRPEHLNGLGIIQGGAIFTLADLALAAASNSHGTAAVLINANIAYVKGISEGVLYAEAREESLHSKLATYVIRVTDEAGDLIASMQATVYRKRESLEAVMQRL
jgi:acyl-CoA thioesterase